MKNTLLFFIQFHFFSYLFFLLILSLFLLAPSPILAATYYISPSGNDTNPGTDFLPFKTVLKGINSTVDGDTVFIKIGNYDLAQLNVTLYKTISIIGEEKSTTILTNGRKITFHKAITVKNLTLKNFATIYYDDAPFKPQAIAGEIIDGATFDNINADNMTNFIYGTGNAGKITNFTVTNCTVTNLISTLWHTDGIRIDTTGEMSNFNISNNIFQNIEANEITGSRDAFGILLGSDEIYTTLGLRNTSNMHIENNTFQHIVGGTADPNAINPVITYPPSGKGIMIYGNDYTINGNRVFDINPAPAHEAIYLKGDYSKITNNIVHNGGTSGDNPAVGAGDICIKGNSTTMPITGNIITGNKITADYSAYVNNPPRAQGRGIGMLIMGGATINNNYVKHPLAYFGIFTGDSNLIPVQTTNVTNNYIEIEGNGGQGIKVTGADNGNVAYNSIVVYNGSPMYIPNEVGGSAYGVLVHDNLTCTGYNCGSPLPPNPSCQNTGYLCCNSCQSGSQPQLDSTCQTGYFCCASCGNSLPSTPAPSIPGDVNGDGHVTLADFLQVISCFAVKGGIEDINLDSKVNGVDMGIVIKNFGR